MDEDEEINDKIYNEIEEYIEREIANNVGFKISLRTYNGDCLTGILNCVKHNAVYVTDNTGNKCYCSIDMISFYTIHKNRKNKNGNKK